MAKAQIFQEIILSENFIDDELDKEIINILSIEKRKNNGVALSNKGGFQTQPIKNEIICNNILKKCYELIFKNFKFKRKCKFFLKNLWINSNEKDCYNAPHIHPNSDFSGVYYLNVPQKNGEIVFYKDNSFGTSGLNDFLDSDYFIDHFQIKPQKGLLLLFPSCMRHMVNPHYEDLSRISISFNIGLSNG